MELNREQIVKVLEEWIKRYKSNYYREHAVNALALIRELTDENESLKLDVEVCGAELSRYTENIVQMAKQDRADTLKDIQTKFAIHFGTYTKDDTIKVSDVFKLLSEFKEEIMEG